MDCGVWTGEHGLCGMDWVHYRLLSMEFREWTVEFGVWSVEYGLCGMDCM